MKSLFRILPFLILLNGAGFSQTDGLKLKGRFPDGPCSTVAVEGNYAFINNGSALEILDISKPDSLKSVGKTDLADAIRLVRVSGDYAFVAGNNGIHVIDIKDKTRPKKISLLDSLKNVGSMFVKDNFVYAATWDPGLAIVDVSSPAEPKVTSTLIDRAYTTNIFVVDSLAYLCSVDSGLYIINVKDKNTPKVSGRYDFNNLYLPNGIFVKDSMAYVTSIPNAVSYNGYGRFHALNIKNPANVTEKGWFNLQGDWRSDGGALVVDGNYAYINHTSDVGEYLSVADLSSPNGIKEVYYESINYHGQLALSNKKLFITGGDSGLHSYDISNPLSPVRGSSYKTGGTSYSVLRKGNYLFAGTSSGIKVVDISEPSSPSEVSSYSKEFDSGSYRKIFINDKLLFASFTGYPGGFRIFSIGDMSNIKKLNELPDAEFLDMKSSGNYVFAAEGYSGFKIYDAANPSHLSEVLSYYGDGIKVTGTAFEDTILCVLEENIGIKIFNFKNPAAVFLINNIQIKNAYLLSLYGDYLYVYVRSEGVKIFNIADPKNPYEAGKIEDTGVTGIKVTGSFAYVYISGLGLKVYSVENPLSPVLVKFDKTIGNLKDMYIDKDYIITAESTKGFSIFTNDIVTSVERGNNQVRDYALLQNYPNPFNPATTISYSIPKNTFVRLKVFDMLGREVATLAESRQNAGEHKVQFNASGLPSGVYIYSIQAGEFSYSRKLLLLK